MRPFFKNTYFLNDPISVNGGKGWPALLFLRSSVLVDLFQFFNLCMIESDHSDGTKPTCTDDFSGHEFIREVNN